MNDFSLPGGVASRRMTDPCGMLVGKAVRGKYVPRALIRPCCQRTHTGQIRGFPQQSRQSALGFSPVVRIGTPPPPHPQASVSPPLWFRWRGEKHSLAGERVRGVPIGTRGQTLWYSRYLLWFVVTFSLSKRCWTLNRTCMFQMFTNAL